MPHSEPQETDPAEAFEGVRRELSLLHRAVQGLTAARDNMPDYSETLGGMDQALKVIGARLRQIEESPAVRLPPAAMAQEINKAAQAVRAEDRKALDEARNVLSRSLGHLDSMIGRGRASDKQFELLLWVGISAFLLGMLLWSILPGAIIRSLPEKWHAPEWMAAQMVDKPTLWEAGMRIMEAGNLTSWRAVGDAVALSHDNRKALGDCKRAARKSERPIGCTIVVGHGGQSNLR
ncbi:hypothetical protein Sj15T_24160 [Sphingobium sp. TA15]|uniref:Uncharacterized protein n=1 Tax=Sphingobium indicum (strain DSM 16413 / CCM 7287 / MTCC 6362 / UT26 / NBRC 101211 / UT26S) TaxID=452662 RepID=D4Z5Y3_SPHIU|nr:DUF6118 family protein [Sphingobium indicum]BAI98015.1 hypothetical protein SJA_C1-31810 [Sphingobium indicum UT26S]BDD67395.1 hypothetical protein Sj15T_24160 [Sphingobium sp. TA15]